MDEPDEDEDEQITVGNVPFAAENDFLLKHGRSFALSYIEGQGVVVAPA